jgi:hypothetical protein
MGRGVFDAPGHFSDAHSAVGRIGRRVALDDEAAGSALLAPFAAESLLECVLGENARRFCR